MDFKPSQLGTKEHWDCEYARDLDTFREIGDEGEIWFGHHVQQRVVRYMSSSKYVSKERRILEAGCGNGAMLVELAGEDFEVFIIHIPFNSLLE